MDPFMHLLGDLGSLLVSACWILMLIDCITNKSVRGGAKVGWLLFIFFTHIFGAVVYFALGRSYLPKKIFLFVRNQLQQNTMVRPQTPIYYQPPRPQQPPYRSYQRGYQAQQSDPPPSPVQPPEQSPYEQPQYDQPQATYPELPPQQ